MKTFQMIFGWLFLAGFTAVGTFYAFDEADHRIGLAGLNLHQKVGVVRYASAQMPGQGQPPNQQPPAYSQPPNQQPPAYSQPPNQQPPAYSQPPNQQPPAYSQPPNQQPPAYSQPPNQQPPTYSQPPNQQPPAYSQPPNQQPPAYSQPPNQQPPTYSQPPNQRPPTYSQPPTNSRPALGLRSPITVGSSIGLRNPVVQPPGGQSRSGPPPAQPQQADYLQAITRYTEVKSRTDATARTWEPIRQSLQRQGQSLRPEIQTALSAMIRFTNQAHNALQMKNIAASHQFMDEAEKQMSLLQKFHDE